MSHETPPSFQTLWQSVAARTGRRVPRWRDFKPAELAPHAGMLIVQDFTDRLHPAIRFAGPDIERMIGTYAASDRANRMSDEDQNIVDPARFLALDTPCGLRIVRNFRKRDSAEPPQTIVSTLLPALDLEDRCVHMLVSSVLNFQLVADGRFYEYRLESIDFLDLGFGTPGPGIFPDLQIQTRLKGQRFIDE